MNLDKLKEIARRNELREEWRKAIDAYHRVAEALAEAGEPVDPALFNRIGDLEIKAGDSMAALGAYQRAADHYAEQGFFNNAIALCGKLLRVDPGQTQAYLRLAELNARKSVIPEAKRNLAEYLERMAGAGQLEKAAEALKGFAARYSASYELLATISELLRQAGSGAPEVEDKLQRLAGASEGEASDASSGPTAQSAKAPTGSSPIPGLVFIDTGIDLHGVPLVPSGEDPFGGGRTLEDGLAEVEEISGFEPTSYDDDAAIGALDADLEALPENSPGIPLLESMDELPRSGGVEAPALTIDAEFDDPLPLEPLALDAVDPMPISLDDAPGASPPPREAVRVESPHHARDAMFDELEVEDGELRSGAWQQSVSVDELERVLAGSEAADDWERALRVSAELIACEPDNLARYQKRVELAYRSGDFHRLMAAYLSLADVLMRTGAPDNALLVYERVLDHDPGNPVALTALAAHGQSPGGESRAQPPPANLGKAEDFIDLGALILDPEPERDSRMRVEQAEPVGDEDKDFLETLAQFKEGIAANIDSEDFQAHYDLGIAFKEMGLLDEAIAQFQKALRAPEGRLKSSEALGTAFFEKGRYSIAEAVLSRAVDALPGADDEKIGLLYWLGRALEAQGRGEPAVRCYERAMAVDITFLDLGERVQRLGAGERS